jgi:hypothetical protein
MKKKTFHPKIANPISKSIVIIGLIFASFGVFIYQQEPDKTIPLASLAFSLLIIFVGLWGIGGVKIYGNIIERSFFLGFVKKRRNLKNLKFIEGSHKNMYRTFTHFPILSFFMKPFFNSVEYANYRYLTLKFRGKSSLVIDGLGMKRKDFEKVHALLKNSLSKNKRSSPNRVTGKK